MKSTFLDELGPDPAGFGTLEHHISSPIITFDGVEFPDIDTHIETLANAPGSYPADGVVYKNAQNLSPLSYAEAVGSNLLTDHTNDPLKSLHKELTASGAVCALSVNGSVLSSKLRIGRGSLYPLVSEIFHSDAVNNPQDDVLRIATVFTIDLSAPGLADEELGTRCIDGEFVMPALHTQAFHRSMADIGSGYSFARSRSAVRTPIIGSSGALWSPPDSVEKVAPEQTFIGIPETTVHAASRLSKDEDKLRVYFELNCRLN